MNGVLYYSNTGACRQIAGYLAEQLHYPLLDMMGTDAFRFENLVVVFPIHCQNIPRAILPILERLTAKNLVVLAAYGRMSYGNVLWECQHRYRWNLVGAAYVPTSHCYIPNDRPFTQWEKLQFVEACLKTPRPVAVPRSFKNPLADFFPEIRTRLGIRLLRNDRCNSCGLCKARCGSKKCIRCLKCIQSCPQQALTFRRSFFMRLYLGKPPKDQLVIYSNIQ